MVTRTEPKTRPPERVGWHKLSFGCLSDQTFVIRYLSALEGRLHDAEALLGVIIGCKDMRARTLVLDLSKDSLANTILKRVDHSVFGPVGRETLRAGGASGSCDSQGAPTNFRRPTDSRRQQMNSREVAMTGDDGMLRRYQPSAPHLVKNHRQSDVQDSQQHLAGLSY